MKTCELCDNPADHTIEQTTGADAGRRWDVCRECLNDVIALRDRLRRAGVRPNPALLVERLAEQRGRR